MQDIGQLHNDAPILKKTVDLYKELYGYLKTFPKKDQYLMGKRCEDNVLVFMELILLAVSLPKSKKLNILERASGKLDVLKVLFRMARELKILISEGLSFGLKFNRADCEFLSWRDNTYHLRSF